MTRHQWLARSSSAPSLPKNDQKVKGNFWTEGTLYLAGAGGAAEWEPFHFSQRADGALLFKASGLEGFSGNPEFVLDADWAKPFLVAPHKPLTVDDGCGSIRLFPFSLSYAQRQRQAQLTKGRRGFLIAGRMELQQAERRSLVLATTSSRARKEWLDNFARKSHRADLRQASTSLSDAAVAFADNSRIPLAPLGQSYTKHSILPSISRSSTTERPQNQSSPASRGEFGQPLHRHTDLLDSINQKQADIERLLDARLNGVAKFDPSLALQQAAVESKSRTETKRAISEESTEVCQRAEPQKTEPDRFPILCRTENAFLDEDILTVHGFSGAVVFKPEDASSFHIALSLLDSLKDHPVFIGIVPENANLTMVNLFDSGVGIFLCLGGQASSSRLSALGAPGGPALHAFGERRQVEGFPDYCAGSIVVMSFAEGDSDCIISFGVTDDSDGTLKAVVPKMRRKIPVTRTWRPCVLLCVPGSRVQLRDVAFNATSLCL